jgi:uncharacterized coiled-coil protein SlyX
MSSAIENKWTNSLFIPRIDFDLTKTQVKDHIELWLKCTVNRVDFVSFNSPSGVGRRAFLHLSSAGCKNKEFMQHIMEHGNYDTCVCGCNVRILINKNPVPETALNLQQVASNTVFLGDEMIVQKEKVEQLENKVAEMQKLLDKQEENMNFMIARFTELTQSVGHLQSLPYLLAMPPPPPMAPYRWNQGHHMSDDKKIELKFPF